MKGITYIGTNSYFFKGSVRDNLLMGDPSATDDKLWQVLSECRMDEFLRSEGNDGLDTMLTENAQNLSGGQKQRLALARALPSPERSCMTARSMYSTRRPAISMWRVRRSFSRESVRLQDVRL